LFGTANSFENLVDCSSGLDVQTSTRLAYVIAKLFGQLRADPPAVEKALRRVDENNFFSHGTQPTSAPDVIAVDLRVLVDVQFRDSHCENEGGETVIHELLNRPEVRTDGEGRRT
ncbi:MAG TPA: hypothetical protein VGP46_06110, partial [Acidimicrobiales bacterium]|nr:hypothetical protein [Acidimicrobiales bacterium]